MRLCGFRLNCRSPISFADQFGQLDKESTDPASAAADNVYS
jgi:hypothetical protein